MGRYSIDGFVRNTSQKDKGEGTFEEETNHLLEVNLSGKVWTKWVPWLLVLVGSGSTRPAYQIKRSGITSMRTGEEMVLMTGPQATVVWSENLKPNLKTDRTLKNLYIDLFAILIDLHYFHIF
ncbi:MAG: hypothetical protein R6V01_02310 [Thermoplasmatota archaeon]